MNRTKFCLRLGFLNLVLVFLNILITLSSGSMLKKVSMQEKIFNTGLLADGDDDLIFVSTLDGALHAVIKSTGVERWTLKDDPVIQNPTNEEDPPIPRFFPNPQDGSLYRYSASRGREPLKKLPFTIPELVANSPCRSNDGIFYIGKKVDSWIGVDALTGQKQLLLNSDAIERVCPKPSRSTIYLGRTLYNVVLYEPNKGHKWNVTFYHYATANSISAAAHIKNYDLVHYLSAGEGSVLTVDQRSGAPLWDLKLESPVVAMYMMDSDGTLVSLPVTAVTPQTLQRFSHSLEQYASRDDGRPQADADVVDDDDDADNERELLVKELSPTIFVGDSDSGVYALPAFADASTARISRRNSQPMLLGGPDGARATMEQKGTKNTQSEEGKRTSDVLLLGYYDMPESLKAELHKASAREMGEFFPLGIEGHDNTSSLPPRNRDSEEEDRDNKEDHYVSDGFHQLLSLNGTYIFGGDAFRWACGVSWVGVTWMFSEPTHLFVAAILICLSAILVMLYRQGQQYARLSREMSSRSSSRGSAPGSTHSESNFDRIAAVEELDGGVIRVGKITFQPDHILGKGCDGTFVFRGHFDGRSVAVKRLLPGCFSIADREVELLRQSDHHSNVIRYFCMEQCREFRYIALELCSSTLEDVVIGRIELDPPIPPLEILRQATEGLSHLHTLDIVHRDIKPHNVLMSFSGGLNGGPRAVISDFGLCKRLESGRRSFSRRSGVTGTDGWIAPELVRDAATRPTCKVDIFSLGCVYYYVMSGGQHPFGAILDRQSNILSNKFGLGALSSEDHLLKRSLVERMLRAAPSERPPATAILAHPLFWNADKTLQFFQDVSDRVEKENPSSMVVASLERGAIDVVRSDWTRHMHPLVAEDLRRFREYNGLAVRSLLRAIRNKKNHYREMNDSARQVFGRIPEDFVPYWTNRFPRLLGHVWFAMQVCKAETIFARFYCQDFSFKRMDIAKEVNFSPIYRRGGAAARKSDPFDFLDSLLGPAGAKKGPRRTPKHETDSGPAAPWVMKKASNLFQPQFNTRIQPAVVNPQQTTDNSQPTNVISESIAEVDVASDIENKNELGNFNNESQITMNLEHKSTLDIESTDSLIPQNSSEDRLTEPFSEVSQAKVIDTESSTVQSIQDEGGVEAQLSQNEIVNDPVETVTQESKETNEKITLTKEKKDKEMPEVKEKNDKPKRRKGKKKNSE